MSVAMLVALFFVAAAFIATGPADGSRKPGAGHRHRVRDGAGASRRLAPEPPRWLRAEARTLAGTLGDGHLARAYWGTPHDPELGDLTKSGPDDPSAWAYVLVFAGDFPESGHSRPAAVGVTPGPAGRMRWRLYVFDDVTHELGVYGEGPHRFDPSAYPSLSALEL